MVEALYTVAVALLVLLAVLLHRRTRSGVATGEDETMYSFNSRQLAGIAEVISVQARLATVASQIAKDGRQRQALSLIGLAEQLNASVEVLMRKHPSAEAIAACGSEPDESALLEEVHDLEDLIETMEQQKQHEGSF